MPLFVFEFLGTTELVAILVVALVLFGPRRLPELGRTLGKTLAEFKRSTEDFKRTWEREVELDKIEREMRVDYAPPEQSLAATPGQGWPPADGAGAPDADDDLLPARTDAQLPQQTVARGSAPPPDTVSTTKDEPVADSAAAPREG